MSKKKTARERGFKELRFYCLNAYWRDETGNVIPSSRWNNNGEHSNMDKACVIIHVTDGEGYTFGNFKRGFFGRKHVGRYSVGYGTKGVDLGISLRGTMQLTWEEWDQIVEQVREAKEEILGQERLF